MKVDAIVNDPVLDSSGYIKIPIDIDYIDDNENSVREWIVQELEAKYIGKQINYNFKVENISEVLEEISEMKNLWKTDLN